MRANRLLKGTTVVVFRTPSCVAAASDSKVIVVGEDSLSLTGDKIHQVDDMLFAQAGLLQDTLGDFNIPSAVRLAHLPGESIRSTADRVVWLIRDSLIHVLKCIRSSHQAYFAEHLDGKYVVYLVFFGFDAALTGQPAVLHCRNFRAYAQGNNIEIEVSCNDCPSPGVADNVIYAFGETTAIDACLDQTPAYLKNAGELVQGLRGLIEIAIQDKPQLVGPPVRVVVFTKEGVTWH